MLEGINVLYKDQFPSKSNLITTSDGEKFRICIETFESFGEYAHVLIEDIATGERYQSDGNIQIRGHTFITKWKTEYDQYRDNYRSTHDLEVFVL